MLLTELDQRIKKAVFTFGRMNPPHYGHGGLIRTMETVAKKESAHWYLFLSSKVEPAKNPLTYEQKCYWVKILFPEVAGHLIEDATIKNPLVAATWLYKQGFREVTFVAGEDDMESYAQMIKSGQEHGRKNPDAVKAGKGFYFDKLDFAISPRLASATNARASVTNNDPRTFATSILGGKATNPKLFNAVEKQLFPMVRKGMQLESINEDSEEDYRRAEMMKPENQKPTALSQGLLKYTPMGDVDKIGTAVNKGDYKSAILPAAQLATNLIPGKAAATAASTAIGAARGLTDESEELNKRTPSVSEIAKKHMTTPDVVHRQINRGVKVEFEHTNDIEVATEIAMDHIGEKLDYYARLAKVEEDELPTLTPTLTIRRSDPKTTGTNNSGNSAWVNTATQGFQQDIAKKAADKTAGVVPGTTYPTLAPVGTMYGSFTDTSGRKINKYVDKELTTRFKPDDEGPWISSKNDPTNTPVGTYLGSFNNDKGNRINKYTGAELTTNFVPADLDKSGYAKIIKNSPISPFNDKVEENFADGKGPGRPGDSQRHGIPKKATMAELEKASHAEGRKGQLARWQLNMRRGKKKATEDGPFKFGNNPDSSTIIDRQVAVNPWDVETPVSEEKKPKKPKTIIDGALKTLIAKGRSEDEAIADLKKEIDSKFYDLTESVMEDDAKPRVYLDMDGVLADFFGEWSRLAGVDHYKDINNAEESLQLVRDHPTFWVDLPMLPHAMALIQTVVQNYGEYRICSKPLEGDARSKPGKMEWIRKNLSGMLPAEVILTADKAAFATHNGHPCILVDDYGVNINAWKAAGGIGIKYDDPLFPKVAPILKKLSSQ